jgi:hypothetical protein
MSKASNLDKFKTSRLDVEEATTKTGGTTTRTGSRTTVSVATDADCLSNDCDAPNPLDNME